MNNEKSQLFEHILTSLAAKMNTDIPELLRSVIHHRANDQSRSLDPSDEYVDKMQVVQEDETVKNKLTLLAKELKNHE